jgi:membrane-bound lytic murein transglycosylase F
MLIGNQVMDTIVKITLRRIADLLVQLFNWITEILGSKVIPALDFFWHSLVDLIDLVNSEQNRETFKSEVLAPVGRVLQKLETKLPTKLQSNRPLQWSLLLLVVLLLFYFSGDSSIEDLRESGELVVISRESATTLYEENGTPTGPEFDYLSSFAEFIGVKLRFDIRENDQQVLEAIKQDEGHIAAAGMTYYPPLEEQGYLFGPGYQDVDIQVVCRRNSGKRPRKIEDMTEIELVVIADSNYEKRLFDIQKEYPDLSWDSIEDSTVDDLLELVWRKEIDCTIANSSEVNIKRRFYPELLVAFTLEEQQTLAWNISPEWGILSGSIEQWLTKIENDGSLLVLKDRHYNAAKFDYVDMRTYIRRMKSRLPRLVPLFQKAADKYGLPWTLLAAQAYQESHWNRRAKSPTGVRGIMMLTLTTAKEMGVKSRLDVEQSIMGGARYLTKLEKRISDDVQGDDRWWLALAAYNVGMGHVHDARKLAKELDLDQNNWLDLRGVLPLLSQKKYYKDLKYGRARGTEPVTYVRKIRNYQNIMLAQFARKAGAHGK